MSNIALSEMQEWWNVVCNGERQQSTETDGRVFPWGAGFKGRYPLKYEEGKICLYSLYTIIFN